MVTRVGINGFGRIGRLVARATMDRYPGKVEVASVTSTPWATYLLRTCITKIGMAKASTLAKKDAINSSTVRRGLALNLRNSSFISDKPLVMRTLYTWYQMVVTSCISSRS